MLTEAVLWGSVAASSLVIGALLAGVRRWPTGQVGLILAFGAGALISAVSFELAAVGFEQGGFAATAVGLAVGAVSFYVASLLVARRVRLARGEGGSTEGRAIVLGSLFEGVPEQLILGIGIATGTGASAGLLAAIFISNVPESVAASAEMEGAGTRPRRVVLMWTGVAIVAAAATVVGFLVADLVSGSTRAAINGFAAGGVIVMLVNSMIPEATRSTGNTAGLAATLGFAVSAAISAAAA